MSEVRRAKREPPMYMESRMTRKMMRTTARKSRFPAKRGYAVWVWVMRHRGAGFISEEHIIFPHICYFMPDCNVQHSIFSLGLSIARQAMGRATKKM